MLSKHKPDRAKILTSQIASKAYFIGEIAGLRLAGRGGQTFYSLLGVVGSRLAD
jgi:hypothetical protein